MNRRSMVFGAAAMFVAGCAGTMDTASSGASADQVLYVMDSEQADDVMRRAMAENFTRQPISDVSVPHRGYTAEIFFAIDRHAITLTAVPATGQDDSGRSVSGYYFEVNHFGSMPLTGGSRANQVLATVKRLAEGEFPTATMA